MKSLSLVGSLALLAVVTAGCDQAAPADSGMASLAAPTADARVVTTISVGGADACEALGLPTGCDANYSLTARVDADGTARGQWQDTFSGGGQGQHSTIDCVHIDGNTAVIGGVVTRGTDGAGNDVTGLRSLTAVVDNGTSQRDPADQIGPSLFGGVTFFPADADCTTFSIEDFEAVGAPYDLTHGQVTIR